MQNTLSIFGIQLQRFGSILALALLAALSIAIIKSNGKFKFSGFLFASVLGLGFSRLFFCIFDANFLQILSLKNIFMLSSGGMSMLGGMIGVMLACLIMHKNGYKEAFDEAVLPMLTFIIFARIAENGTGLGLSRPLAESVEQSAFIVKEDWGSFIRVWKIEGIIAAVLFLTMTVLSFKNKNQRKGSLALKFIMLFGAAQIIMESLKYDGHMRFSFISVQQILALLMLLVPVLVMSIKAISQKSHKTLGLIGILMIIIVPTVGLGIEFAIDRSEISKITLYIAYITLLIFPLVQGLMLTRRIFNGQGKNCENK